MRGTKQSPIEVYDWSEAFDVCREMNRPIYVETEEPDESGNYRGRVFPSGYAENLSAANRATVHPDHVELDLTA